MKRVTVTVGPDDYEALDELAPRSGVSASWLIRRSMLGSLERHNEDPTIEIPPGRAAA